MTLIINIWYKTFLFLFFFFLERKSFFKPLESHLLEEETITQKNVYWWISKNVYKKNRNIVFSHNKSIVLIY